MNNSQRRAVATVLAEDGWVVTKAEVDAVIAQIREDLEAGILEAMPEDIADLDDDDAYLSEAADAIYSRTGDNVIARTYRDALADAVDLALQGRLAFGSDEAYWEDANERQTIQAGA
jgi:hypothetical protein